MDLTLGQTPPSIISLWCRSGKSALSFCRRSRFVSAHVCRLSCFYGNWDTKGCTGIAGAAQYGVPLIWVVLHKQHRVGFLHALGVVSLWQSACCSLHGLYLCPLGVLLDLVSLDPRLGSLEQPVELDLFLYCYL
jgi:hypothetical protein